MLKILSYCRYPGQDSVLSLQRNAVPHLSYCEVEKLASGNSMQPTASCGAPRAIQLVLIIITGVEIKSIQAIGGAAVGQTDRADHGFKN